MRRVLFLCRPIVPSAGNRDKQGVPFAMNQKQQGARLLFSSCGLKFLNRVDGLVIHLLNETMDPTAAIRPHLKKPSAKDAKTDKQPQRHEDTKKRHK